MHLCLLIRGETRSVARFFKELSSIKLPLWQRVNINGQWIQGSTRKYLIDVTFRVNVIGYEIIFPEEYRDIMLTSILGKRDKSDRIHNGGRPWNPKHKIPLFFLRKLMGLDKIPKYSDDKKINIFRENMEIIAIGIKKDTRDAVGNENL